jgi:hypothetical protein
MNIIESVHKHRIMWRRCEKENGMERKRTEQLMAWSGAIQPLAALGEARMGLRIRQRDGSR